MEYNFSHLRADKPDYRHTAKGEWAARLEPDKPVNSGQDPEEYFGDGVMNYQSATKSKIDQEPGCTETFTEQPVNGTVGGKVRGAFNTRGQPLPDLPPEFVMGIADAGSAPHEVETLTIACPDAFTMVNTVYVIMIGALNALDMMDDGLYLETGKLPGLRLDVWESKPDGTLERNLTGGKTLSVILADGTAFDIEVISQNNLLRLRPLYGPPQD